MITKEHIDFVVDFLNKNGRTEQMKIRDAMTDNLGLPAVTIDNFLDEVRFTEKLMDEVMRYNHIRKEAYTITDSVFYSPLDK